MFSHIVYSLYTSRLVLLWDPTRISRALYIDDDPDKMFLVSRAFSKSGIDVHTYSHVEDLLKEAVSSPDILVLDYHMPSLSGVETARVLRRHGYSCPLVFLTSDTEINVSHLPPDIDCLRVFSFPDSLDDLTQMIRYITFVSKDVSRRRGERVTARREELSLRLSSPNMAVSATIMDVSTSGMGIISEDPILSVGEVVLAHESGMPFRVVWTDDKNEQRAGLELCRKDRSSVLSGKAGHFSSRTPLAR